MRAAAEKQRAAAATQREAVHKQQDLLRLPPLIDPASLELAAPPPCNPIADAAVDPILEAAAKAQDLEANLLRAVIRQESAFYPCAVSDKGARGLMQLMPSTIEQFGVRDPFDPKSSVDAGAKYLKQLMEKYNGNLSLALGAYNAGPSTVDEAHGVPDIPETRAYVQAILQELGKNDELAKKPPAAPVLDNPPKPAP